MSEALFSNLGGLRFWTEKEILIREQAIQTLKRELSSTLQELNSAWTFHQMEGPILTPNNYVSAAYTEDDVFMLKADLAGLPASLRAETTASSYAYADFLLKSGKAKPPVCVWQYGKSFRRELSDGATASKLRYNEFYQLEFQCIYKEGTKADYRAAVEPAIGNAINQIVGAKDFYRIVESDRLPAYSTCTRDVEVWYNPNKVHSGDWKEMASISTRTDFPGYVVLEVAIGLDRLVAVRIQN